MSDLQKGDYVLATKWHDGDSRDQWCCGFFEGMTEHKEPRYDVVDNEGSLFRNNGFRRCEKIHPAIGKYLIEKSQYISAIKLPLWEYVASEAHDILVENWDYENKPQEEPTDRFAMGTPDVAHAGENKEVKPSTGQTWTHKQKDYDVKIDYINRTGDVVVEEVATGQRDGFGRKVFLERFSPKSKEGDA